jgi:hypothetical protein
MPKNPTTKRGTFSQKSIMDGGDVASRQDQWLI